MPAPRAAYTRALKKSGLDESALGRDWSAAGERAVSQATSIHLPFRESVYLPAEQPGAVAYRLELHEGQRLVVQVSAQSAAPGDAFIDVLEQRGDNARDVRTIAEAAAREPALEVDVKRSGSYYVRVQPELLRGGRYTVTLDMRSAVLFPVEGRDARAIISPFGVDRDEGTRSHEGVDIQAPRGTRALATVDATVTAVQNTPIGGKVVWLREDRSNLSLYYAHLDEQRVQAGQRVKRGDVIGLVGNTGNARGGSPHLHFGVYVDRQHALDPAKYLSDAASIVTPSALDTLLIGSWSRSARANVRLRAGPGEDAPIITELARGSALRVMGGTAGWYRILLPDAVTGFVAANLLEAATPPARTERLAAATALLDLPKSDAAVMENLAAGTEVAVLANYAGYIYTRTTSGGVGWIARPSR